MYNAINAQIINKRSATSTFCHQRKWHAKHVTRHRIHDPRDFGAAVWR